MPETDIGGAGASDLTGVVQDFSVEEKSLDSPETVVRGGRFPFLKKMGNKRLDMLAVNMGHFERHPLIYQEFAELTNRL